jgi:hypothetical protein
MSDRSGHLPVIPVFRDAEESWLARKSLECAFNMMIESGSIPVGDRQADDVLADFNEWLRSLAAPNPADEVWNFSIEHRDRLLEQAEQNAAGGEHAIALILYATWIEHSINDLISRALERQNVSYESTSTLLRAVNVDNKITALWEVAGIPAMDTKLRKSIKKIADVRNEFVHYKWHPEAKAHDPQAESSRDRYEGVIKVCENVVSAITDLAESYLWDGRRDELMSAFRIRYPAQPQT